MTASLGLGGRARNSKFLQGGLNVAKAICVDKIARDGIVEEFKDYGAQLIAKVDSFIR